MINSDIGEKGGYIPNQNFDFHSLSLTLFHLKFYDESGCLKTTGLAVFSDSTFIVEVTEIWIVYRYLAKMWSA